MNDKDTGDDTKQRNAEQGVPAVSLAINLPKVALVTLAGIALVAALYLARAVVIPVVMSALISFTLNPIVTGMHRLKIPRFIGAAIVLIAITAALTFLGYILRDNVANLLELLPVAAVRLQEVLRDIDIHIATQDLKAHEYLWWGTRNALVLVSQFIVVFFLVYFLLISGGLFKRKFLAIAQSSLSRAVTIEILDEIEDQIERFLFMTLIRIVVVAIATWIALLAFGLANAAVWGILAGVVNTLPYIGPTLATGAIWIAATLQFESVWMGVLIAGVALIITGLDGYLLATWLMSRAAHMNAVAVLVSLLFWGWMWGAWGVLLAVPVTMAIKVIADRVDPLKPIGELLGR